jgi:hypothetical protein
MAGGAQILANRRNAYRSPELPSAPRCRRAEAEAGKLGSFVRACDLARGRRVFLPPIPDAEPCRSRICETKPICCNVDDGKGGEKGENVMVGASLDPAAQRVFRREVRGKTFGLSRVVETQDFASLR